MKEMVAGCCVCSDERGWTENPLVYCDGIGCNIGVHQACYGIVSVPDGNWYCRKCESQERSARVRCELCPSKDGALKRTDNGGWAHVVCGLYIPEVRFGSVTTMEPIVLSQIPTERYNKVCYICEQNNRGSRASMGACMQCNKAGCKQQFHVTCAQAMGLLCEEAGNYLDNVKYCGYCQEHYNKLKKGANVKTIPAYRPPSSNNSGSEDSPEKKLPSNHNHNQSPTDPKQTTKRKSSSNRPASQNGPPRATPADRKEVLTDHLNGSISANLPPSSTASYSSKSDNSSRFTTSNFVESVIIPSESVFADVQKSKKRKINEQQSPLSLSISSNTISDLMDPTLNNPNSVNVDDVNCDNDDNDEDSQLKFIEEPNLSALKAETLNAPPPETYNPAPSTSVANVTTIIYSSSTTSISSTSSVLPFAGSNCTFTNPVSSSYLTTSATFTDVKTSKNDTQVDKGRSKSKRSMGSTNSTKKGNKISIEDQDSSSVNGPTEPPVSFSSNNSNIIYSERSLTSQSTLSVKSEPEPISATSNPTGVVESKDSLPISPVNSVVQKSSKNDERADKEMKAFQSGSSAPHMLGNQLNPASSMAQKMSDALNDELEAHSIFTTADVNSSASSFVGPPLYNKIISTTRATDSSKRSNSPSNGPLASLSGSAANFPQSLEELLETQWEQGGTFLMEQAQHFDIASLLTCLHKLREENLGLEETIRKLKARRDHLLGVNARLAMPLAPISQPVNNVHTSSQTPPQQHQQHSSSMSQTIPQQTSSQQHHGQQMALVSPPSQLQQISMSTQQKPSTNLAIGSLPPGISDPSNSMRNIPLPPSSIYAASCSTSTTLRGPHASVYQNAHSMENGLLSNTTHHQSPQQQHARGLHGQANAGSGRHLSSASNASLYSNSQPVSNQGVVVRAPNVSDVSRADRRNTSVVSSNYQPAYQIPSLTHQQQMAMHREDAYHSAHTKPN